MNGWLFGGSGAVFGLVLVVLLVICGFSVWLESRWVTYQGGYSQPDQDRFVYTQNPRTEAGLAYEDVSFPTANGAILRGWIVPSSGPGELVVIVFHGAGGDRRSGLGHLRMLHDLGATVLLFDAREHGMSDGSGRGIGLGVREAEDGIAAVDEMRKRGFSKVVGFGCSLGGSAAIISAATDERIDGIIVEASLASFERYVAEKADRRLARFKIRASTLTRLWGETVIGVTRLRLGLKDYVKPEDVIMEIAPRPVFLIHGGQDFWVSQYHAKVLMERSGQKADYWHIENAGHCDGFQVAGDEYRARVASFLARFQSMNDDLPVLQP